VPEAFGSTMHGLRRIGPIGTWSRAVVGVALVVVGFLGTVRPSGIGWYELVLGLAALPLLVVMVAVIVGHYRSSPFASPAPGDRGQLSGHRRSGLQPRHGPTVELSNGCTLLVAACEDNRAARPRCSPTWSLAATTRSAALFSPIDNAERHHRQASGRN